MSQLSEFRSYGPRWLSDVSNDDSSHSSPRDDPPDFEDPLLLSAQRFDSQRFDFPDPSHRVSPTSSNEAEADIDSIVEDWKNDDSQFAVDVISPNRSPNWSVSGMSPGSSISETNPFVDESLVSGSDDGADVNVEVVSPKEKID